MSRTRPAPLPVTTSRKGARGRWHQAGCDHRACLRQPPPLIALGLVASEGQAIADIAAGDSATVDTLGRTFQDLCRAAHASTLAKKSVSGHATDERTEHDSRVATEEQRGALTRVVGLLQEEPSSPSEGGEKGGSESPDSSET